jgi:hypothetical protein
VGLGFVEKKIPRILAGKSKRPKDKIRKV